ncbi:hypothetical protein DYQ86_21830 [Acidobacteria bacterium AB60]|nr:hypothetical protein DYQ86_21830 [Acidobacteria bacterium AB60]
MAPLNYQGGLPLVGPFSVSAPQGSDRVMVLVNGADGTVAAARDFKGQTIPGALNGGTTVALNTADKAASQPITYNAVPAGYSQPTTHVALELGGAGALTLATSANGSYPALPASAVESGDTYFLLSISPNSAKIGEAVVGSATLSAAAPVSFNFPPPWTYAGPAPASLPSFTFQYAGFSGKTGVADEVAISWLNNTSANSYTYNYIQVIATANFQGSATTLAVPDLSAVAGFLAPPASGKTVTWSATITQASSAPLQPTPPDYSWTGVSNTGTYTAP